MYSGSTKLDVMGGRAFQRSVSRKQLRQPILTMHYMEHLAAARRDAVETSAPVTRLGSHVPPDATLEGLATTAKTLTQKRFQDKKPKV